MNKYLYGSIIYGTLYSIYKTHNIKLYRDDEKKIVTPLLTLERINLVILGSIITPSILPFQLYNKINKFQINYRGHNYEDYGYKNNTSEIITFKELIDKIIIDR